MLAMVHAFKTWKHFLMGSDTTVYTDSSFLKFLTTLKDPSPRVTRWLGVLALYHYTIVHIQGSTNTAADALSRSPLYGAMNFLEIDNEASWETDYKADPVLRNEYYDEAGNLRDRSEERRVGKEC